MPIDSIDSQAMITLWIGILNGSHLRGGYSLERLRRFWTSPGKQGRDEKLYQVPKNSEDWPWGPLGLWAGWAGCFGGKPAAF